MPLGVNLKLMKSIHPNDYRSVSSIHVRSKTKMQRPGMHFYTYLPSGKCFIRELLLFILSKDEN